MFQSGDEREGGRRGRSTLGKAGRGKKSGKRPFSVSWDELCMQHVQHSRFQLCPNIPLT